MKQGFPELKYKDDNFKNLVINTRVQKYEPKANKLSRSFNTRLKAEPLSAVTAL
jgi:hypothetical protein